MTAFFVIVFFVLGWRAKSLSLKYYLGIIIAAGMVILTTISDRQNAAHRLGYQVTFDVLTVIGAWLYSAAWLVAGLLAGAWLGNRRRLAKAMRRQQNVEEVEMDSPSL